MQDEIELDYSEMNERCKVDIPPNVNWGKPKEDNQFTHTPSYKKLWEQWTDTQKADFLEDFYKEQAEYGTRTITANPPMRILLDKTKHRLVPIKETETESTVEYKVVEK